MAQCCAVACCHNLPATIADDMAHRCSISWQQLLWTSKEPTIPWPHTNDHFTMTSPYLLTWKGGYALATVESRWTEEKTDKLIALFEERLCPYSTKITRVTCIVLIASSSFSLQHISNKDDRCNSCLFPAWIANHFPVNIYAARMRA